jgi:hypothetical protein
MYQRFIRKKSPVQWVDLPGGGAGFHERGRLVSDLRLAGASTRVRGFAGRKVEVCRQPDGRLLVYLERRLLLEQPATPDRPVRGLTMNRSAAPRKKKPARIYKLGGRLANRA